MIECKKCIHYNICVNFTSKWVVETTNKAMNNGTCLPCDNYLPTADVVEVKHGEWYLHPDGSGTCSNCNRIQKSVWDFDNIQNYCPNCGAKMDGERRENENNRT